MNMNHPPPKKNNWSWKSQNFRSLVYQVVAVVTILVALLYLAHNTSVNMEQRGIQSGYGFLTSSAGFDIGESLFPYDSNDPYWKAYLTGFSNTVRVALLGIVLTTILGTLIGVGRFSRNALVRGLCITYVEFFRNIPVLLQLIMWYLMFTEVLPDSKEPIVFGSFFLSKGGLNFPIPDWKLGHDLALAGFVVGLVIAVIYRRRAIAHFEATGHIKSLFWVPLGITLATALLGWVVGGAPTGMNVPIQGNFSIENGGSLTPEFLSVLLGLTIYTSSYIAEVVRGGIASVSHGQTEAASALGLNRGQTMRLILLPQALRVIIPPVTNQYLNLTKNSSLAVAIGYPDIVSISNTAINQTGRAIECISIIMLVYLVLSVGTSMLMNWYNKKAAILER